MLYVAAFGDLSRPLSVPFLFRTSGKGTDTAVILTVKLAELDLSLNLAVRLKFILLSVHSSICVFFLSANSTAQVSKGVDCICEDLGILLKG